MFFYKTVDQWNHIIISDRNASIILYIFVPDFSILINNQLRCISITIHIMIITDIVLRKNKRNLPFREKDLSFCYIAISICLSHIIDTDHDIAFLIHSLYNLVEFIDRCHNLIVISFFIVSIKCFRWIFYQCMIKNMCNFFQWPGLTGSFYFFILFYRILHFCILFIATVFLKQADCLVIIILYCEKLRICQNFLRGSLIHFQI